MPKIIATLIAPSIDVGGAERWMYNLVKYTDKNVLEWNSCIITHEPCDQNMLKSLSELLPVYYNNKLYYAGQWNERTQKECIDTAKKKGDIVIVWELCAECMNRIGRTNKHIY